MTAGRIRILVADDHAMVRTGLTTMLTIFDELVFVGAATDGQAAIEMCDQCQPDLVLMDMHMPAVDGVTATRAIRQKHPQIKVLALTAYMQDPIIKQALQAGAAGYLHKSVSLDELISAIHSIFAGQVILAPQAAESLLRTPPVEAETSFGLTERERQVLQLMINGLSNNAIAERLHISPLTVKSHVSSVLAKMGVATRAEAVAAATQRKLFL